LSAPPDSLDPQNSSLIEPLAVERILFTLLLAAAADLLLARLPRALYSLCAKVVLPSSGTFDLRLDSLFFCSSPLGVNQKGVFLYPLPLYVIGNEGFSKLFCRRTRLPSILFFPLLPYGADLFFLLAFSRSSLRKITRAVTSSVLSPFLSLYR